MPSPLSLFSIRGLHGRRDISVPVVDNRLILVGENGTGKSTVANLMFYFLTRQWYRISRYRFTSIEATLGDLEFRVTPELIAAYDEYFHHIHVASRHLPASARDLVTKAGAEIGIDRLIEDKEIQRKLSFEFGISGSAVREMLVRWWKESKTLEPPALERISRQLSGLFSERFLYLPTYRRIEQDLKSIFPGTEIEAEIKKVRDKIVRRAAYTELVAFGMEDVERTIAERMIQIKEGVRKELNNLTGTYLRDVLRGVHSSVNIDSLRALDALTLDAIFARIDESTLPKFDQERLRTKVADMANRTTANQDDKVIAHFLSKLIDLYKEQQASESDVRNFVRVCNEYLTGKELVYDDVKYEIHIHATQESGLFPDLGEQLSLKMLSSGEKQIVSLFSHIYLTRDQFFVIIDEPELSLSVPWQRRFLPDILNTGQCTGLIAVTHSPFIWDNDLEPYVRSIVEYTGAHHAVVP